MVDLDVPRIYIWNLNDIKSFFDDLQISLKTNLKR